MSLVMLKLSSKSERNKQGTMIQSVLAIRYIVAAKMQIKQEA